MQLLRWYQFHWAQFFVPGKKYFAGNYGFTLKKIESVVGVVVVGVVVGVVVSKSSERFKALPIELESWAFSMLLVGEKLLQISFFLKIRQSVRPVRHFCRTVSRSAEKSWNLLFLDRLSSYSGFRSRLGWEVMK